MAEMKTETLMAWETGTRSSVVSRKTEKLMLFPHLSLWTEVCIRDKGSPERLLTAHLSAEVFEGSGLFLLCGRTGLRK